MDCISPHAEQVFIGGSEDHGRRDLLTEDHLWLTFPDQTKPGGPQVPLVGVSVPFARNAERLAGTAPGPNNSVWFPSRVLQGEFPPPDPGKEVAAGVAPHVGGLDLEDGSVIYVALR